MLRASDRDKGVSVLLIAVLGSTVIFAAQSGQAFAIVNSIPTIDPIPDQVVDELSTLTFNVTAFDPDGQQLTFSMQGAPYGASINSTTGVFTWTPAENQGSGVYSIDIVVSDGLVISGQRVLIIVNDVGGGGHGGGKNVELVPNSPEIGSSSLGSTNLFADPASIPLDTTTNLIQEAEPVNTGKLMSLTVQEPDGDVCEANSSESEIPDGGLGMEYPTDFSLLTEGGDGTCDTSHIGTYYAESQVNTTGGLVQDTTQFETQSPFVLPESPVGLIALMASSLAAFGGFMALRGRISRV